MEIGHKQAMMMMMTISPLMSQHLSTNSRHGRVMVIISSQYDGVHWKHTFYLIFVSFRLAQDHLLVAILCRYITQWSELDNQLSFILCCPIYPPWEEARVVYVLMPPQWNLSAEPLNILNRQEKDKYTIVENHYDFFPFEDCRITKPI